VLLAFLRHVVELSIRTTQGRCAAMRSCAALRFIIPVAGVAVAGMFCSLLFYSSIPVFLYFLFALSLCHPFRLCYYFFCHSYSNLPSLTLLTLSPFFTTSHEHATPHYSIPRHTIHAIEHTHNLLFSLLSRNLMAFSAKPKRIGWGALLNSVKEKKQKGENEEEEKPIKKIKSSAEEVCPFRTIYF
jgi:hypothetical protein